MAVALPENSVGFDVFPCELPDVGTVVGVFVEFEEVTLVQYAIPVFNSVMCMTGIFNCKLPIVCVVITVCSNIAVTAVLVAVLSKMFKSEKIVY